MVRLLFMINQIMIEEPILERGRCVCKCYLGVLVYSGYDTQFHHEHFLVFGSEKIYLYIYTQQCSLIICLVGCLDTQTWRGGMQYSWRKWNGEDPEVKGLRFDAEFGRSGDTWILVKKKRPIRCWHNTTCQRFNMISTFAT